MMKPLPSLAKSFSGVRPSAAASPTARKEEQSPDKQTEPPFAASPSRQVADLVFACVAIFALVSVSRAERGALWLDANLASKHSEKHYLWENRVREYNERNFGLGATYELNGWSEVKAGWFENSYSKTSVYGMLNLKKNLFPSHRWLIAPGLAAGLVTGYQDTPEQTGALAPWGLITLTVGDQSRWRLNLGYLPSRLFRKNAIDFGTLQLAWRL